MFRLPTYLPLVAAVAVVTTWAAFRADSAAPLPAVDGRDTWMLTQALPPGHPPVDGMTPRLPEGHPPVGELNLPPGHPPICPGRSKGDRPGRAVAPDPARPPILST